MKIAWPWNSSSIWNGKARRLVGLWVPVALVWLAMATASADEIAGPEVKVLDAEPGSPVASEVNHEAWNPAAVVGPNVSWETQRRIPGYSAFVNGTGYWGPSLHPDSD
ncbi:MAG: hypothetical protein VCB42_11735 [Myxococcota bacterium]